MKGSLRQHSPGSWDLTVDLGRDSLGKRHRKRLTVHGTKAQAQRKLSELLSALERGSDPAVPEATGDQSPDEVGLPGPRQSVRLRTRAVNQSGPQPAPLPRHRDVPDWPEPSGREQAAGTRQRVLTSDIYTHVMQGWQKQTAEAFAEVMEG